MNKFIELVRECVDDLDNPLVFVLSAIAMALCITAIVLSLITMFVVLF